MAKKSIRIRANLKNNLIVVKALMSHAMETGLRKDKKTGDKIPAHFIEEVNCEHNGKVVLEAKWGVAVSRNPYLSFKLSEGSAGDNIKINWTDNFGKSDSTESKVR